MVWALYAVRVGRVEALTGTQKKKRADSLGTDGVRASQEMVWQYMSGDGMATYTVGVGRVEAGVLGLFSLPDPSLGRRLSIRLPPA